MALPEAAQRYADRIDVWSDERIGNEYIFIDYVRGWKSGSDPLGYVHGDTAPTSRQRYFALPTLSHATALNAFHNHFAPRGRGHHEQNRDRQVERRKRARVGGGA